MTEVLFFSDAEVKRKLFDRIRAARRPVLVAQVRHAPGGAPPAQREPFATFERSWGARVDMVLVADEGRAEAMWRDPVGDLAEAVFPDDREAAYAAVTGYLLLLPGEGNERTLGVRAATSKRHGSAKADLWFLQGLLSRFVDGIPPPKPSERPGRTPMMDDEAEPTPVWSTRRTRSRRGANSAAGRTRPGHGTAQASSEDEARSAGPRARTRSTSTPQVEAPGSPDPWKVLGIPRGTPLPAAKKAFHALIAQYHPDKVSHLAPEFRELAETRTRALLEAWRRVEAGEAD